MATTTSTTIAQDSLDWVQQVRDKLLDIQDALQDPSTSEGLVRDVQNLFDAIGRLLPGSIEPRAVASIRAARDKIQGALADVTAAIADIPGAT